MRFWGAGRWSWIVCLMALLAFVGCGGDRRGSEGIQIKGSDTEVNLAQRLAEAFMKQRPDIPISVTGGGSGTGIASLIDGRTDIANSSREMKPEEIERARGRGVNPTETIFAQDRLALIVHQDNPVEALTLEQVAKIYKGEIANWKEVNGPDQEISLYGRQSNSGTYIYFRDHLLKGDYSSQMKMMNGNAQIVEGVKRDQAAIGYVGIGYVVREGQVIEGIRVLGIIREPGGEVVSPVEKGEGAGEAYPLSRPLYQYTNGPPQGVVAEFIQFELSPAGQELVAQEGFFPLK